MQGKKAAGHHFPKRCCPNATVPRRRKRVPNRCKTMQARNHERYLLKEAVAANSASQATSISWLRAKDIEPIIALRARADPATLHPGFADAQPGRRVCSFTIGNYFADAGNAGNLSMSRASCWMMTVALRFAAIFLRRSSDATVWARSKLNAGTPSES